MLSSTPRPAQPPVLRQIRPHDHQGRLTTSLDLGFRVPGIEGIAKAGVPYNTQVRFYTESQRDLFADSLEQNLPKMVTLDTPLSVESVMLSGDLPGGTFEVWLGRNDCEG